MALHFILQDLDSSGTYARILFLDFSSAFITINPALLQDNLFLLSVPDSQSQDHRLPVQQEAACEAGETCL